MEERLYEVEGQMRIEAPEETDIAIVSHQKGYTLSGFETTAKPVLNVNSKEEYSH